MRIVMRKQLSVLKKLLEKPYGGIQNLIKNIHFHPNHPENHNVKITNKKLPYALVWNDKIWETRNKKEVIEDLVDKGYMIMDTTNEIIDETIGGAHRDRNLMIQNIRDSISKNLRHFKNMSSEEIFNDRKNKFLRIGRSKGFMSNVEDLSSLKLLKNNLGQIWKFKKIFMSIIALGIIALIAIIILL